MTDLRSNINQVIKKRSEEELDVWPLPTVEKPTTPEEDEKTNAFGKKSNWRYEPPEEMEVEEPQPLTAEEIEEIRQAAYEEGFGQGKEEGFAKGYEEGKVKGHEEGLVKGHEEGVASGLEAGKATIDALGESWQSLTNQLHQPMANLDKNVEEQLLIMLVQLTEAVVLQEAKINPDILMAAISTGIKALPSQEAQTQILLHPDDIKQVEQQFGAEHIQDNGWRLLPAPQLARGSCQIENSTSNIDLQMKSRLKQVLESFLEQALHH